MKILLTGNTYSSSPEQLYLRLLKNRQDLEVDFIATGKMFLNKRKSIVGKLLYRIAPDKLKKSIQTALMKHVDSFKPDVLFVFKGFEISVKTLETIKAKGIKLINFNGDHPFAYDSKGSGNQDTLNSIQLFDLYLTYSKHIQAQMNNRYSTRTGVLPFGFDQNAVGNFDALDPINKVCFVGNPDNKRAQYIKRIANAGIEVDVYGNNWSKFLHDTPTINLFPPATGKKYWQTLHRYNVQLNIMRTHNENSHNMRTFEVPGIGGIMLTEKTEEQLDFFHKGEVFFYSNEEELISETERVLGLSEAERENTRTKARNSVLNDGHTYESRCTQLIELIQSL